MPRGGPLEARGGVDWVSGLASVDLWKLWRGGSLESMDGTVKITWCRAGSWVVVATWQLLELVARASHEQNETDTSQEVYNNQ